MHDIFFFPLLYPQTMFVPCTSRFSSQLVSFCQGLVEGIADHPPRALGIQARCCNIVTPLSHSRLPLAGANQQRTGSSYPLVSGRLHYDPRDTRKRQTSAWLEACCKNVMNVGSLHQVNWKPKKHPSPEIRTPSS